MQGAKLRKETTNRRLAYCTVLLYNRKQYNLTMADRGRNM